MRIIVATHEQFTEIWTRLTPSQRLADHGLLFLPEVNAAIIIDDDLYMAKLPDDAVDDNFSLKALRKKIFNQEFDSLYPS